MKSWSYYVADFETTVYTGQECTQVWAAAIVPLGVDYNIKDVRILHAIEDFMECVYAEPGNLVIYFHNLKFDGEFVLWHLINEGYKQAYVVSNAEEGKEQYAFYRDKDMLNNTFKYCISDMGQWYYILLKQNGRYIQFRDSLKLLPFSVKKIGEGFRTEHRKLDMNYEGYRFPGCTITDEEKAYISNDVMVIKEALDIMFKEGHNKMTIGSCCLSEFSKFFDKEDYNALFPNLYEIPLRGHDANTVGDWIKKSYRGGWCYIVPEKANKIYHNGVTVDVNSLYPSMMSSESGNVYPVAKPKFWSGNYIPEEAYGKYYFVRFKTKFDIKSGYLPFVQMKGNLLYRQTESLKTSKVWNRVTKQYDDYIIKDGKLEEVMCEITMTMTDFKLFQEHYEIHYLEILDGCYFFTMTPAELFDAYISRYKKIKQESKGAPRELAKLFLNNLYGKMASSTNSSFKIAFLREDGSLGYKTQIAHDKEPGYIPIGSAITSYARNFTIRAAQKNYYGVNHPGFIYADTDSIHCDLPEEELKGVVIHDTNFCCWKIEGKWDTALFVRQKTYIEHIITGDPYYCVKCAGMPEKCKELFMHSVMQDLTQEQLEKDYNEEEQIFLKTKRELTDFKIGLNVPSKLRPVHIVGGVLLVPTSYEMR